MNSEPLVQMYEKNRLLKLFYKPYCELCGTTNGILDCHHIVYRSEAPNHPNLHHEDNLIVLCREHHDAMHNNKDIRDALINKRKLRNIFSQLQARNVKL